jgi:hypothetical protein
MDASGTFVIVNGGMAGWLGFSSSAAIGDFGAGATLKLEINNTEEQIDVAGPFGAVLLEPGPFIRIVISDLTIELFGLTIEGDFSYRDAVQDNETITVIIGNNVRVFVGDDRGNDDSNDDIGIELTDGRAVLIQQGDIEAGFIEGRVQLVGIDGLELDATMKLRYNEFTHIDYGLKDISDEFILDGETIDIEFIGPDEFAVVQNNQTNPFIQVSGSDIHLSVVDIIDLRGEHLTVTRQGTTFLVGAAGVEAFLGAGPAWDNDGNTNPDAVGIMVAVSNLGMVIKGDGTFAFAGDGTVSLIGLEGLEVSGQLDVNMNRTGEQVDVPVVGQNDPIALPDGILDFSGNLDIKYDGIFELSGTVNILQLPNGYVDVRIDTANLKILSVSNFSSSDEKFGISGRANFRIGGAEGFRLQDFRINGLTVFGLELINSELTLIPSRPLTADLLYPFNGAVVDLDELNNKMYIDILFNDVNGEGINSNTINGDEFRVKKADGTDITNDLDFLSPVRLFGNIYRYVFQYNDVFNEEIEYIVEFQAGTWEDGATPPNTNIKEDERFLSLLGSNLARAPPTARLTNPAGGIAVDPAMLNSRRFIDVTFESRSDDPIDPSTINGTELSISGSGVTNARLKDGPPTRLFNSTYRYFLIVDDPNRTVPDPTDPSDPSKRITQPMFGSGELHVTFNGASFEAGGVGSLEKTEVIILDASKSSSVDTDDPINIGPLVLEQPSIGLEDFGFNDGKVILTIGINVDAAWLDFEDTDSVPTQSQQDESTTAKLEKIFATFDLGVGLPGDLSFSPTGKFSLSVSKLIANVPDVVQAVAEGISIQYDPEGEDNQELVSIDRATLTFPTFNISGEISPFDPDPADPNNDLIPGLVVRGNGFTLGQAQIIYNNTISLGSILDLDDLRIGVTNFEVNFDEGFQFNGSIFFASGGATFFPGQSFNATIIDRDTADDRNPDGTPNDEALRAEITFTNGSPDTLLFKVDTLRIALGGVLTLTARDFELDTGAAGDAGVELVSFGAVGAEVKVGSMLISGEGRNFAFMGDGTFETLPGFGVFLSVGSASGEGFGWPDWLPIRINAIGVEWPDIGTDPADFDLILSASVTGLHGIGGLEFSGTIEGIRIDIGKLRAGRFPVEAIASIGVGVKGDLFGGTIDAQMVGGIVRLDENGDIIDELDTTTQVEERVMFMGLQGGFEISGIGLTIRLGMSEMGPLSVFLSLSIPGGVVIVPQPGLAINDFAGGVEFFKTIPSIDDPFELRNFNLPTETSPADWLNDLKQQVVAQYKAIQNNPSMNGFAAAFTAPMTITGSAKVFSIYTSKQVFNGQVIVQFSTDGKFLVIGKLNFANDALSVSGRLYADLSNVTAGDVTVLFLADVPDQVALLTIDGRLKMGFRNDTGEEIEIPVANLDPVDSVTETSGILTFPGDGEAVDVGILNANLSNSQYYVDVGFLPGTNQKLDYDSILDNEHEISLSLDDSPIEIDGKPIPIELAEHPLTGILTESTSVTFAAKIGTNTFTLQDGSGSTLATIDSSSLDAAGLQAAIEGELDDGISVVVSDNGNGTVTIRIFDLQATVGNTVVAQVNGNALTTFASAEDLKQKGIQHFRYFITETSFSWQPGVVGVTFVEGSWGQSDGTANAAEIETFTILGPTAALANPPNGGNIRINELQDRMFLDIEFSPTRTTGAGIDANSLNDGAPEIEITLHDGTALTVDDDPTQPDDFAGTNVFRYSFTGSLTLGTVTVTLSAGAFADSSLYFNTAQTLTFTIDGSTADLRGPAVGEVVGLTVFQGNPYIDVSFNPASGAGIDAGTLIDSEPEIEIILSDGTALAVSDDPTQPVELAGTNVYRYGFTGTIVPGEVIVTFLDSSFADLSGVTNIEEVETFFVEQPTAELSNLADGASYLSTNINDQASDLYDDAASGRYFELLFAPTGEADIDVSTVDETDLTITGVSGITVESVERVTDNDGDTNRFRFLYTGDFSVSSPSSPLVVTISMAAGAWQDEAGNASAELSAMISVRRPATTFYIELDGGMTLDSAGLLPEPIFDIRGYVNFEAKQTPSGPRFELDFGGTFQVIYLGNIASAAGKFILQIPDPLIYDRPISFSMDDIIDLPSLLNKLENQTDGVSDYVWNALSSATQTLLTDPSSTPEDKQSALIQELNNIIQSGSIYDAARFSGVDLSQDTDDLLAQNPTGDDLVLLNRMLLRDAYPEIRKVPDPDAVTAGELLGDLGISFELDHIVNRIQLPKLWGVIKIETNFEKLKEVGLDLKAAALLELNTTRTIKTETITLEGIPGDELTDAGDNVVQLAATDALIDQLNSETLPDDLVNLFSVAGISLSNYSVDTFIGGVLWKVIDEFPDPADPEKTIKKQYFIQKQDISDPDSGGAADLQFRIRGETQEFNLQPKTLMVQAFGQAIFRYPAFANPEKTELGPEWFRASGAFSIKLSTNSLEMFQNGQLTISPNGQTILDIRSMGVLIIKANPAGIAGKLKLGAVIDLPGIFLSGSLEAFINTFGTDQVFEVSTFLQPVVGFSSVTIFGAPPKLNPNYDPADATSPILVEDETAIPAAYFAIAARADLELLGTLTLSGAFRISASTQKVEVQAAVGTDITIPNTSITLFQLSGTAAFAIDGDGIYGRADFGLAGAALVPGFDLSVEILLEFNTASISKDIQTFEFDTTTGDKGLDVVTVSLAPQTLHLAAGGELDFILNTGVYLGKPFSLAGRFDFTISTSHLEIQAEVSVTGGPVSNAGAAGALRLSSAGLAGFIRISVAAGAGDPGAGDTISGTGFELGFNLALYINTGSSDVILSGVTLPVNQVKLEASGYLQLTIGGVIGFRIEGNLVVSADPEGFTVAVDGLLLAKVGSATLVRLDAFGGLKVENIGTAQIPVYLIAGKLDLTQSNNSILDGNGFILNAALSLEVNTTNGAVDLDGDGQNDLESGVYARIHADGQLGFQVGGNTGFLLDGVFDVEVGTNGLLVAADADFLAQVAGLTIFRLKAVSALLINGSGIAAKIGLSLGANASTGGSGFSFGGSFTFEINTTGNSVPQIGSVTVNLAPGPYVRLDIDGHLQILGSSTTGFRMEGGFTIQAGSSGLEVGADATLKAIVGGTTLLSLDAVGALLIPRFLWAAGSAERDSGSPEVLPLKSIRPTDTSALLQDSR